MHALKVQEGLMSPLGVEAIRTQRKILLDQYSDTGIHTYFSRLEKHNFIFFALLVQLLTNNGQRT